MDFDYEGAEDYGGRILWGRIAVFGAALLLALILGRCTAGGGVDEAQFEAVVASNSEAQVALTTSQATIEQLQRELVEARAASQPSTTATGSEGAATGTEGAAAGDGTQTGADGNRTYVVQSGDTLSTIAESVYGDPTAFGAIASANNLSGDSPLQVGQELVIPSNPDQQ